MRRWIFAMALWFGLSGGAAISDLEPLGPSRQLCIDVLHSVIRSVSRREKRIGAPGATAILADREAQRLARELLRVPEKDDYYRLREDSVVSFADPTPGELAGVVREVEKLGAKLFYDPKVEYASVELTSEGKLALVLPGRGVDRIVRAHEYSHIRELYALGEEVRAADPRLSPAEATALAFAYTNSASGIEWLELKAIREEFELHLAGNKFPEEIGDAVKFANDTLALSNYPEREALHHAIEAKRTAFKAANLGRSAFPVREKILEEAAEREFKSLVADICRRLVRRHMNARAMVEKRLGQQLTNYESHGDFQNAAIYREKLARYRGRPANLESFFHGFIDISEENLAMLRPVFEDVYLAQRFGILDALERVSDPILPAQIPQLFRQLGRRQTPPVDSALLVRDANSADAQLRLLVVDADSAKRQSDGGVTVTIKKRDRDTEKKLVAAVGRLAAEKPSGVALSEAADDVSSLQFGGSSPIQLMRWIRLPTTAEFN